MIKHEKLEKNAGFLLILTLVVISIGGLIEIVPLFYINDTIEEVKKEITVTKKDAAGNVVKDERGRTVREKVVVDAIRPYTPLELLGRNIYVSEGCYNCHSQQIRPMQDEFMRYGHYSLAAESQYDHPFQWGSRRIGPDLARIGGKASNRWHVDHLVDPKSQVPSSIMPRYPWLVKKDLYYADVKSHMKALRITGVPYSANEKEYKANVIRFGEEVANLLIIDTVEINGKPLTRMDKDKDGKSIKVEINATTNLELQAKKGYDPTNPDRITQMNALVAYLQMLGTLYEFRQDQGIEFSEFR